MKIKLGTTIPLVILVTGAINLGARLLPPETYTFRAWEALVLRKASFGGFAPNQVYAREQSYGDLAALGNYPELREYRKERFTTDACGNRNPQDIFSLPTPDLLIIGDSFSVGSGVEDDNTLASVLRREHNRRVYNAAGTGIYDPRWVTALAKKLGMKSGTVLVDYLERETSPINTTDSRWRDGSVDPCFGSASAMTAQKYKDLARPYIKVSPLQIFVRNALRKIRNNVILPNREQKNVLVGELHTGERMLFLPSELDQYYMEREVAPSVSLWKEYSEAIAPAGLKLVVLLIPNKLNVYSETLAKPELPYRRDTYLASLEQELRRSGVEVINLEGHFKDLAKAEARGGSPVFWRDDTHWREGGIKKAAEIIDKHLLSQEHLSPPQLLANRVHSTKN